MIELDPREGMRQLAKTVVATSLKDLSPTHTHAKRQEAIMFFESGERFSLMCDLADLDERIVREEYRQIIKNNPLVDSSNGTVRKKKPVNIMPGWYLQGKIGVYRNSDLVMVVETVKEASASTGLTRPSIYSSIKSGEPVGGYLFRRQLVMAGKRMNMVLRIAVYLNGKRIGMVDGYAKASKLSGLSWHTVMRYASSGRVTGKGYSFRRLEGKR